MVPLLTRVKNRLINPGRSRAIWSASAKPALGFLIVCAALVAAPNAGAVSNGEALTPPMGWNGYNHFGCAGINENVVKAQAAALASTGMQAAGYQYINLDDCWEDTYRDAQGNLQNDPTTFPSGIPALASYIHQLGLKLGIYEDAGTLTCGGRAGSYGHYDQDAQTFASWGVDYVKIDWCNTTGLDPKTQYTQFAAAIAKANPKMTFSICDWGMSQPWTWAPAIANLWRTSPDIGDSWVSVIANMDAASQFAADASPGAWNDPDMLEVGNGGMSDTEDRTHFSMWAMLSAPLIAGNDLTAMSATTLATLTNAEVIAVDQDPLGKQAILLSDNGAGLQIWSKQVTGGTVVALLNRSAASAIISVDWNQIGIDTSESVAIRDLWAGQDLGSAVGSFSATVPSHGVSLLKFDTVGTPPAQTIYEANSPENLRQGTASVVPCPGANGSSCLDGYLVEGIGSGADNSITIKDVTAPASGAYHLLVYAGVYPSLTYAISVNGGARTLLTMSGPRFGMPASAGLQIQLNAGENTIEFYNPVDPAPDLDHILISGPFSTAAGFDFLYPMQSLSISSAGQSATATVGLVPIDGFSGTVQVSCALPAAMLDATCSAASVNLQGGASATASLLINTTASTTASVAASEQRNSRAEGKDLGQGRRRATGSNRLAMAWLLPLPALGIWTMRRRRNAAFKCLLAVVWLAGTLSIGVGMTACGANGSGNAPTCSAAPAAPSGLTATAVGMSSTTLSWTPGATAANCAIVNYSVYENGALVGTTTGTSYVATGLAPATTYVFKVIATDTVGASESANVNVETSAPPPTATPAGTYTVAVTATAGSVSKTTDIQVTVQ